MPMTRIEFLTDLCAFMAEAVSGMLLPVKPTKEDREPEDRAAEVYKMRLPNKKSYQDKAPYIINQIVASRDFQYPGELPEAACTVRTIFCVYSEDEMEGALYLLNLMERVRQPILRDQIISDLYQIDMDEGLKDGIYTEQPAPFFIGEMASVWHIPTTEREVPNCPNL